MTFFLQNIPNFSLCLYALLLVEADNWDLLQDLTEYCRIIDLDEMENTFYSSLYFWLATFIG